VFYVGSFRHRPNIIGFEKLRHEVMPLVWQRFGGRAFGWSPDPIRSNTGAPSSIGDYPRELDRVIRMHAFVEDLRPLYAKASVVAVPLESIGGNQY